MPNEVSKKADLQDDLIANVGNIFYFSGTEQLCANSNVVRLILENLWTMFNGLFEDKHRKPLNQFVICVVPLPYLSTYYSTTVQDAYIYQNKNISLMQLTDKKESLFLRLALDQHSEPNIWKQGDNVVAILLHYKWSAFIRKRFFALCTIHLVYYITYCTGVQFAFEMMATTLQLLESRKLIHYLKFGYNFIDIVAIVFPIISFLQLRLNSNYFVEISSVCTLILWLHGIIRLRVFSSFGIALEILLQLFRKVSSVLLILLLVVFGFTHSFIVLLRKQDDQYFQENYSGETVLDGQSSMTGNTTLYDISSSNGFTDPFKAFYQVWLFIFGVWDPITAGDAGDSRMLFALCIIFAFITVLIFTNMIIALMSSTVEDVKQRGKKVWLTHFAAVIAEIESLTTMSTRFDRGNDPPFVFYAGNTENVKAQEEKLNQETNELRKILKIDENESINTDEVLKSNTQTKLEEAEMALENLLRHLKEKMQNINELKEELEKEIFNSKKLREKLKEEVQDKKNLKEDLKKEILNNTGLKEKLEEEMQNNRESKNDLEKERMNNSIQLQNNYQLLAKKIEESQD